MDNRPVFFDVSDDSYFLIDPAEEADFLQLYGSGEVSTDKHLQHALGVQHKVQIVRAISPEPAESLLDATENGMRGQLRDLPGIAAVLLRARKLLGSRPIYEILDFPTKHLPLETSTAELVNRALRFALIRKLVPLPKSCLSDSLALLRWLSFPAETMLIFGAKLEPFAAHCWVQLDQLLLNDHLEYVRQFRPVRVLKCTSAF